MAEIVGIPLTYASGAEATRLAVGGSVERNVAPLSTGPTLRESTSAQLEYLLSQAVAFSESDHDALSCCLNDALAILRGHLRGSAANTRRCGLMRWQTHLAIEYINANLPSKVTLAHDRQHEEVEQIIQRRSVQRRIRARQLHRIREVVPAAVRHWPSAQHLVSCRERDTGKQA
jgi:hypothetical protein